MKNSNIRIEETNESLTLIFTGDIEIASLKRIKEGIKNIDKTKDIIINMEKVDYIDSSGIGFLLQLNKIQETKNKKLRLIKISKPVFSVLEVSSLSAMFEILEVGD